MTQAQVQTGFGTYGPQTVAAVTKLQQDLGVNNTSGPGYFGPMTYAAVQNQGYSSPFKAAASDISNANPTISSPTSTVAKVAVTSSKNSPSNTSSVAGLTYDPSWAQYGITQAMWNSMNATQQATVGVVMSAAKGLYATTSSPISLADALKSAASDPTIIATYGDALKLDTQAFAQNLQQLQIALSSTSQQQQTQMENERKALAEQEAAAGAAYSGFRGKAQADLAQSESAIVTSSRAQAQKALQDATAAFEAKYGTAATTPAAATFLNPMASSNISLSGQYIPTPATTENLISPVAGGVTGTQPIAQQQAINTEAGNIVTLGTPPPVTQP
jgi:hypothetical protein